MPRLKNADKGYQMKKPHVIYSLHGSDPNLYYCVNQHMNFNQNGYNFFI